MERVYMDNCMTTKPDPEVISAMMPYFTDKYYFPANFVSTGSNTQNDLAEFKQIIANSMGAKTNEIHFTSGGTSANNIGIKGYLMANSNKGTHIICSVIDYPDILTNAAFFENSGFEVTYLNADYDGFVDLDELKAAIRPDTIMVMTTFANHVMGTIQPIKEMRKIIDETNQNIALFVDAGHAYGRIDIDVNEYGIDLMSVSAHKIHGPQGVGALYVRSGLQLASTKHGINRIDSLDTGGISIAGIAGFAKAVQLQFSNLQAHIAKMVALRNRLYEGIKKNIPHILLNGPEGNKRIAHNLNVSFDYIEGEAILMMLDVNNITVATGSACASQGLKPNYILMATGRNFVQSHGSIRFTLSRFTTEEEVDYVIEKLTTIVEELRSRSPLYEKNK
ncbi:MAG: cysteine desulfurase family protein [Candidatus Cloacimonadales bacterium]|nr:cysteine desulfurase [Candidatus Cloacimonadota bacterium]MDD3501326.1 cysteine desulfurase family protein [Candidatus Cloacimonadota bacterium]MDX9977022.1 cysteine desulfurase family protein [Candidatus Cloacimonadales bacterium]